MVAYKEERKIEGSIRRKGEKSEGVNKWVPQ